MNMKRNLLGSTLGFGLAAGMASVAIADEITIATVNNGDMIRIGKKPPATPSTGSYWKKTCCVRT